MNIGRSGLVILVPLTSMFRDIPTWVEFKPGEAGLTKPSWAIPEAVRSVSRSRLLEFMGVAPEARLQEVVRNLRYLIPT
jgi:mRNA interferase MazF